MTAVTVDDELRNPLHVVHKLLDIDEGYTYTAELSKVIFCHITKREDSDAIVNYTVSGNTITFHESTGSGVKVAVSIYGYM